MLIFEIDNILSDTSINQHNKKRIPPSCWKWKFYLKKTNEGKQLLSEEAWNIYLYKLGPISVSEQCKI